MLLSEENKHVNLWIRHVSGSTEYVGDESRFVSLLQSYSSNEDVYITREGRKVCLDGPMQRTGTYHIVPRLVGGKGGFGSMLRTIGAQIEKTTSREACRDLSGRRMRDINNEKKLQEWVGKKAEKEKEAEEAKKKKRERRREPPKHTFEDTKYLEEIEATSDRVADAFQQGLQQSGPSGLGKRPMTSTSSAGPSKRSRFALDDDDDLSSSSDEDELKYGKALHIPEECPAPSGSTGKQLSGALRSGPDDEKLTENSSEHSKPSSSHTVCKDSSDEPVSDHNTAATNSSLTSQLKIETSQPKMETTEPTSKQQPEEETIVEVILEDYSDSASLEKCGLGSLKVALTSRGLKCGGTLEERARRLFSVKGLQPDEIPAALKVKEKGKGKAANK